MRRQFDTWVPPKSPLRNIAAEIAQLNALAWPSFLSRAGKEPSNILANAELATTWTGPSNYSMRSILEWKGTPPALHGFASKSKQSCRGISLLFDPFVDAFLAAHFSTGSAIEPGCTVLVLTDYYPAASSNHPTTDWGETETRNILSGRVNGQNSTITQLFDALFGKSSWRAQATTIADGIVGQRLLLWNFFPMFRGPGTPTGSAGLPTAGDWRLKCWDLLCKFLIAVNASRTVLASSQAMLPIPRNSSQKVNLNNITLPGLRSPLPLLHCKNGIHRISHPSSWKRVHQDGLVLASILGNRITDRAH